MAQDCTFTVPPADDESRLVPCGLPAIVTFEGRNPTRWTEEPYHGALCRVHGEQFAHMAVGEMVTFTRLSDTDEDDTWTTPPCRPAGMVLRGCAGVGESRFNHTGSSYGR